MKNMILSNSLRLMLDRCAPDKSMLQILDDAPVNLVAKILHSAMHCLKHNRSLVIGKLALKNKSNVK